MIVLRAEKHGAERVVVVAGLSKNSFSEVRFQDTMMGATHVRVSESDADGIAHVDFPKFDQHFATSVRTLTPDEDHIVHSLVFHESSSESELVMYDPASGPYLVDRPLAIFNPDDSAMIGEEQTHV